jgi:CheY-like chemotaxis protein
MAIRALVCDDDAPIRHMVRDILESRGVEVLEAVDGLEALAIFSKEHVDLVVTDFLMPRVDGMQVVRGIRLAGERGQVPLVLMSAISRGHILEGQPDIVPDFYVNKPFKPKKMAKLLDRILAGLTERA